jgi:hypothetical protein
MADWKLVSSAAGETIGGALWDIRRADLLGQIVMLAAGVFMIKVILPKKKEGSPEARTNK